MFMCKCFYRNQLNDLCPPEPEPFSLPAPIPQWPPGMKIDCKGLIFGNSECGFCLVFGLFMDFGLKGLWIVMNAFNCGGYICFFLFLMSGVCIN